MPLIAARPDRRRLLRVAGVGLLGLAVGVGVTLAAHGLGGRPERAASVERLDLPAGTAPAATPDGPGTAPAPAAVAAVRLGTRDGLLWYHLAAVEADLGMTAAARRHLAEAFQITPYLTVRDQPTALALAGRLHLPAPSRTSGR